MRQALKFLAPERIPLNPERGFAPDSGAVVNLEAAVESIRKAVAWYSSRATSRKRVGLH